MVNDGSLPNLITYPSTINYLDGSEAVLHKIISDPSFSEQQSWRDKTDWAQYYHLSPLRKNIVSWINYGDKPIRILELGAGCGAITSYLVTIPNAEVVAVEGSLDRAKVIQTRCKDTSNLQIHACSLDSFSPGHKFDVITLIGVLEYSGRYEKGANPFVSVLKRAAEWLTPDGTLIVAIENQLGCKYISGCPEDHYGTAYEGINRYPNYSGVRTFTSKALSSILSISGLPVQKWYYPYPDYKLPSVIFSDSALSNPDFDWMALTDVPPEPNENTKPTFNDRSFLTLLQEVTSISHFMNSFLVCASRDESAKLISQNSDTIAVKLNTKFRASKFQTSTIFTKKESTISVVKKRLFPILPSVDHELYWQIQGTPESS
jgi:2-polyprenyl-3-methyl-5-hydroxy-6-metoxy-1,4-benzoquinol methylase